MELHAAITRSGLVLLCVPSTPLARRWLGVYTSLKLLLLSCAQPPTGTSFKRV